MALYSVWNWDRNAWAVFQTSTPVSVGDDPDPPRPRATSPIGVDPDVAVKELPQNARFLGFDHLCRGEVRRLRGGPGVGQTDDSMGLADVLRHPAVLVGAGLVGGWTLHKMLRHGGRR